MKNTKSIRELHRPKIIEDQLSFQDDQTNKKYQFDQRFGSCNTDNKIQFLQPFQQRKMYSYKFSNEQKQQQQRNKLQPNDVIMMSMTKTSGLTFPKIVLLSQDCYIGVQDNYYLLNFNGNIEYIYRKAEKNSSLKLFDAVYLKKNKVQQMTAQQQSNQILIISIETFQQPNAPNKTNGHIKQTNKIKENFIHIHLCQLKIDTHAIMLQKALKFTDQHIYYEITSFQKKKEVKHNKSGISFKSNFGTIANDALKSNIAPLKLLKLPQAGKASPKNPKNIIRRGQKCLTSINSSTYENQTQTIQTYVIKDYALLGEKENIIIDNSLPSIFSSKILLLAISLNRQSQMPKKQKSQKILASKFNLENKKMYEDCQLILIDIQQSSVKDNSCSSIKSFPDILQEKKYRNCQVGKFFVKNFIKFAKPDISNRLAVITKDQIYDLTQKQDSKMQDQIAHTYNLSIQDHIFFKPCQLDSKFKWKQRKSALSLKPFTVRSKLNNYNNKNKYSSPDVAFRLMMQQQNIIDGCFSPDSLKLIILTTFRILYIEQQGIILSENIEDVRTFSNSFKRNSHGQLEEFQENYISSNQAISSKSLDYFYDQIIAVQNNLIMRNSKTCEVDILKLQQNRLHFIRRINYMNQIKTDYLKKIKDKATLQSRIVSCRDIISQKIEEVWITSFTKSCQHLNYMNSNSIYIQFIKQIVSQLENSNQKHIFQLKVCKLKPLITSQTFDLFQMHFDDTFYLKSKTNTEKQQKNKVFSELVKATNYLFKSIINQQYKNPDQLINKSINNEKNIINCQFCKSMPIIILFKDGYIQAWKLPKFSKNSMDHIENLFKDQFTFLMKNQEKIISISIHPMGIQFLIHTTHNLYFCQFQTYFYTLLLAIPVKNKHISLAFFNQEGNYLVIAGQQAFKDKNICLEIIDCFSMTIKKKLQISSGGKYCPDWITTNKQVKAFYFLGDFAILYCKLWKRSCTVKNYIFYIDCRDNNIIYSCQIPKEAQLIHQIDSKMMIFAGENSQIQYIWHEKVLNNYHLLESMEHINLLQSFKVNFKENQQPSAIQMNQDLGFIFIGTNLGNVYEVYYPSSNLFVQEDNIREYVSAYIYSISSRKIIKLHLSAHLRLLHAVCQFGHIYCLQLKQFKNYTEMSSSVYNVSAGLTQNSIISFIVKDYLLSNHIPCIKKILQNLEDKITELNYLVMKCISEKQIGDKNAKIYEKLYETENQNVGKHIKNMNKQHERMKYNGKNKKKQLEEMVLSLQTEHALQIQNQKKIYDSQLLIVYNKLANIYEQRQQLQKQQEIQRKIMEQNLSSVQQNYQYQCEKMLTNMESKILEIKDGTVIYNPDITQRVVSEENKEQLQQIRSNYLSEYLAQLRKQQSKRQQLLKDNMNLDKKCKIYKQKTVEIQSITKRFTLGLVALEDELKKKKQQNQQLYQYGNGLTKQIEKQRGLQQLIASIDEKNQLKAKFQYHILINQHHQNHQQQEILNQQLKETNLITKINKQHKKSYKLEEEIKLKNNEIQLLKNKKKIQNQKLFVSKLHLQRTFQLIESVQQYSFLTGQHNEELLTNYFNELMTLLFKKESKEILKSSLQRKRQISFNLSKQKQQQMIKSSLNSQRYLIKSIKLQEIAIQQGKKLSKGPRYSEEGIILMSSYNQLRKENKQILSKQTQIKQQIARIRQEQLNFIQNQKKVRSNSQKEKPKRLSSNNIKVGTPFQNYWNRRQSIQTLYTQENEQEQKNIQKINSSTELRSMLKNLGAKSTKSYFSGNKQQINLEKTAKQLQAMSRTKFSTEVVKSIEKFKLNGKLDDKKIAKFYYLNKNRGILKL